MTHAPTPEFQKLLAKGQAHDWGDTLPQVGDTVEWLGSTSSFSGLVRGQCYIVTHAYLRASDREAFVGFEDDNEMRSFYLWRVAPVTGFNPDLPYTTRGGHPVTNLQRSDNGLRADVTIGEHTLTLNYSRQGLFFQSAENPVDLVNHG